MPTSFIHRLHLQLLKRSVIEACKATASQRVSLVAAGCAFYATLALFPAITMLISLYGLAFDPTTVQPHLHYLQEFMPPAAFQLISDRIQSLVASPARSLGISFFVSLLISLWSASTGTKSVMNALTLAYHQTEQRGFFKFQLVSLGMTLIAILGAVLAIAILVLIPVVFAFVGLTVIGATLVSLSSAVVMISFIITSLGLLYRFGPSGSGRIFFVPGAAFATIVWLLGSWAFGLYVEHFAVYNATYGPLATLIGLMMWFYLTAYTMLFGAELNAALDREWHHQRKRPPDP